MSPRATDALSVTRLDSAEIPQEDQFDAWHQATAPLFDTALASDPATFSAGVTCYLVDSLLFTRTQFDHMHFSRGTAHLVGGETDCITVQYYKTGVIRGCLDDGTPLIMTPDRISIHDFAHAYSGFGQTAEQYGVVIPRDQVSARDRIYRHRPMFSWGLDSPQGRLLTSGPGKKRVREVAERWGFHNASHFHRLFKQRFGVPPSEVLAASARSSPSMPDSAKAGFLTEVERIRGWLQRC